MALRVSTGFSRKVGQPDYGSIGANCQVEFELDPSLLGDLDTFHEKVREAYIACCQAVSDELARHQERQDLIDQRVAGSGASPVGSNENPSSANGNGTNSRPATEKQMKFIGNLARGIKNLGNGQLDELSTRMFGKPSGNTNSLEASALIDQLKAIKAGDVDIGTALGERANG